MHSSKGYDRSVAEPGCRWERVVARLGADTWMGFPVWLWLAVAAGIAHLAYIGATWIFSPIDEWWLAASDSRHYVEGAESVLRGRYATVSDDPLGLMRYHRVPGYAVVLALFATVTRTAVGTPWAVLMNPVFAAAFAASTYLITRRLGLRSEIAIAVGLLAAAHPTSVALSPLLLTDTPAMALVTAGLFMVVRCVQRDGPIRDAVAGGLLVGFAAIMRPAALLAMILWPILAMVWPQRRRALLVVPVAFFVAAIAMPLAWTVHVYQQTGVATINTHTAFHRHVYYSTHVASRGVQAVHRRLVDDAFERYEDAIRSGELNSERELVRWHEAQADSFFNRGAGGFLPAFVRSSMASLASPSKTYRILFPALSTKPTRIAFGGASLGLLALMVAGIAVLVRFRRWRAFIALLSLLGGVLLMNVTVGAIGGARLMLPAAFTTLTLTAVGAWSCASLIFRGRLADPMVGETDQA